MKFEVRYPAVLWTSIVAGTFSLIVCLLLAIDFVGRGKYELFDTPQYLSLKDQLRDKPTDQQLEQSIRQLDLELRADYFRRRQFMVTGVYLLLGGVIVTLVTARWASSLRAKTPRPPTAGEPVDMLQHEQRWGRWGVAGLVATLLILLGGFAWLADRMLPVSWQELADQPAGQTPANGVPVSVAHGSGSGAVPKPTDSPSQHSGQDASQHGGKTAPDSPAPQPTTEELPSHDTYLAQWPRFRGPTGSGISSLTDIPTQWNAADGAGVLWKVAIPLPGHNSPVVWQDRVFISGATAEEQGVFCFDANKGDLLWRLDVPPDLAGAEEFEVMESTGYAAPTMATDGLRAYAIFASGNVVAADWAGRQLWRKSLGVPKNPYGHASSLATYKDLLIVQFDQGTAEAGKSKLIALHGASGDVAWEVPRQVSSSWATPIVVEHGGRTMVITCVAPWVIAYAAEDGSELWRAKCLGGEVGPSPAFADGVVYAANESGGMFAIRTDGSGDVTESHIEWMTDIDVPDVCSPLVTDKYVLLLSHGLLACFDRAKGEEGSSAEEPREPLWEEDLVEEVSASPSLVSEFVYLFADEGKVFILKPEADKCERVGELEMGEPCRASPAFQPGRIYMRGEEHLFCIGK